MGYWDNICEMQKRQTEKGIKAYGQRLEDNKDLTPIQRLEYLQEELIDEAIAKYKEITNTDANCPAHCNISCDKCVHESEQLAEWLEELKSYRASVFSGDMTRKMLKEAYNKAIDDVIMFAKLHRKYAENTKDDYVNFNDFIEYAEQLKAGGENEI